MEKRKLEQLAVYEIKSDIQALSLKDLKDFYIKKASEVVYITKKNRLYGIVCLGDILHHNYAWEEVKINRAFCSVTGFDVIKAHEFFLERKNVNKIPIVNEKGELLADYSRWEDMFFVERNYTWFSQKEIISKILASYKMVYVVEPCDIKNKSYLYLVSCLEQFGIRHVMLKKDETSHNMSEEDIVIFLNEDERRGMQCLMQVELEQDGKIKTSLRKEKWITYKQLLSQIIQENDLRLIRTLGDFTELPYKDINVKASILLSKLRQKGIHCVSIYADDSPETEYMKQFRKNLEERLRVSPCLKEAPWVTGEVAEKFWGELYQLEDYKNGEVQKELAGGASKGRYKDLDGKYCKMRNGRRVTFYQPDKYIGTIYFLGVCIMFGLYAEDQFTIESYLQKKLLEMGYPYRVENYASLLRTDAELEDRLIEIGSYNTNDIIVYYSQTGEVAGIPSRRLWDIYERNNVPIDWVTDWYVHCNNKVNRILADSILEMLEPNLSIMEAQESNININLKKWMKEYVYYKYLSKYFNQFKKDEYHTVGAIVMNCNPFSKGHRYLIEFAKQQVEVLIVFVVEENASLFSFEERYKMVSEGTKDLENVMVVPSGEFILSRNTFQEYFTKVETELINLNAEYDINVFADYIAKPLHITHRFAGEEPTDKVTKIYNDAMKRVLPSKGISFVEIPRIKIQDSIISASKVREYLKCREYNKAAEFLPDTTISFMLG